VDSALSQRGADVRVVIVDDGSTDRLDELVASWHEPRVSYLRHADSRGVGAARNTGVAACTGQWLAFLDADDFWPHARFLQLSAAVRAPEREIAVGHMLIFMDGSEPDPGRDHPVAAEPIAAIAGGGLLHRELFLEIGPFDEDLPMGEFVDWMSRARHAGVEERLVPTISLFRRSHSSNMTRTRQGEFTAYLDVVARARARQRAARDG
jgi:glycosyltransferase involved in cell wall biosynthesis